MNRKENRGGILKNEDVERELNIRGDADHSGRSYRGTQDTGDNTVRPLGTEVQRRDGLASEDVQEDQKGENKDPE